MLIRLAIITILALTLYVTPSFAEPPTAPGPKDRCGVCGMFVAPYVNWVSVIQFKNNTKTYFDGPKDMFTYIFDLKKYRSDLNENDISDIYVTEYYTTQLKKANEVFFVVGSDVMGPMGNELVPIQGQDKAKTFLRDHGGKKIMHFDGKTLSEITITE